MASLLVQGGGDRVQREGFIGQKLSGEFGRRVSGWGGVVLGVSMSCAGLVCGIRA